MDQTAFQRLVEQTLADALDGETILVCQKHGYAPGPDRAPAKGCKDCWFACYLSLYARLPEGERDEWLDDMYTALRHANEAVEQGTWDLELFPHPEITREPN